MDESKIVGCAPKYKTMFYTTFLIDDILMLELESESLT